MRAWWILLATGCWTAAPRPGVEPEVRPPVATGTCTIRDRFVHTDDEHEHPMKLVELALDGSIFARPPAVEKLELRVGGTKLARAHVESATVVLSGDLDLASFDVRPRDPEPREGWLHVGVANVQRAKGALAQLVVELPKGLAPRTAVVDVPCDQLTSIAGDGYATPDGDPVMLARGAHLLAATRGPRVARVDEDYFEATRIDRDGDKVRVVIGGESSTVIAWIAASDVSTPPRGGGGRGFGTIGTGSYGTTRTIFCAHDLAIHARSARRGEVRVGHLKAGQTIKVNAKLSVPDETALDLGGDIAAYVRVADLAGC